MPKQFDQDPPPLPPGFLRVIPLGGVGEIGRNMAVLEFGGRLLIIDCGVLFPEDDQPGVDLILPDFSYLRSRLGDVDADALAATEGVIVNIDYPLGVAAYNILREVAVDSSMLRGVYVLGKAATLNADVTTLPPSARCRRSKRRALQRGTRDGARSPVARRAPARRGTPRRTRRPPRSRRPR